MKKLSEIRKDAFYTDSKAVYYKDGKNIVMYSKKKDGICTCYFYDMEIEVEKVQKGQEFYDGDIVIIDEKTIDLNSTTYNYFKKQFVTLEDAEKYAKENRVEVFNSIKYQEYYTVEFKKDTVKREVVNLKDLK